MKTEFFNLMCLGRNGDIINALALARILAEIAPVSFQVGRDFAPLLDGVSYVRPVVSPYAPDQVHLALRDRRTNLRQLRVCQTHSNPALRSPRCGSYAEEAFYLAGAQTQFLQSLPLFDARNEDREAVLCSKWLDDRPTILIAGAGVSSPLDISATVACIRDRFPFCNIVDMSSVQAERVYDLLGLFERADALVSIDTVHLWLARCVPIPTVAIVNTGWRGSPSPPSAACAMPYDSVDDHAVCEALARVLSGPGRTILAVDQFGSEERHARALDSHIGAADIFLSQSKWGKTSADYGCRESLPLLNSVLQTALSHATSMSDVIVWTNSDVEIRPGGLARVAKHVAKYGAVTIRRENSHYGREMFAATAAWLTDNLEDMPNMIISMPWFDLTLAAYVRKQAGLRSNIQNLTQDMPPCEMPNDDIFSHPEHPESWQSKKDWDAYKYNELMFQKALAI